MKFSRLIRLVCSSLVVFLIFVSAAPFTFAAPQSENLDQAQNQLQTQSFNELGLIPVLEYHHIGPTEERWTRSYENFKKDLEWLYNNDYRAVSIADYVGQKIAIPFGKKPVIFTFDDGVDSQIQMDADGEVSRNTAVGIMDEFLKMHPDFGSAAVFYINRNYFSASSDRAKTLDYLIKTGREVQNHTASHADLSKIPATEVEAELSWFDALQLPSPHPLSSHLSIAYPFGGVPKNESLKIVQKYAQIGFLVGADPAPMPYHKKFDAHHIPRIQGIDEEWARWFKRASGASAKQQSSEIFTPFVSDGDANTLTILDEKNFNKNAIRKDLTIKIDQPLPYIACNDPYAESFIQYKHSGLFGRILKGFRADQFPDNVGHLLYSWFRQDVLFPEPSGIYFTSSTVANQTGKNLSDRLLKSGGNMIIFDVKETPGVVYAKELKERVKGFQEKGLYVVARIVVFKDQRMTAVKPSLAIQNAGGGVWQDDKGVPWMDPSNPEAQDYIIGLAKEVAEAGVDEIQYDYVRFPTEGNLNSARYHNVGEHKWHTIRDFLRRSREALMPYGVKLSADVFGIVGWNKGYDAKSTGQKIECIAPYLDAIYPMGYPSHFGPGFAGYKNPADEPYDFTYKTTKAFVDFAKGTATDIRPWLQAFTYRVTIPYNTDYIVQQIKAARDAGGNGFALWNAGNNYEVTWGAFLSPTLKH